MEIKARGSDRERSLLFARTNRPDSQPKQEAGAKGLKVMTEFPLDKPGAIFLRCPLTRETGASLTIHGDASVEALDKLIDLLVAIRNHFAGYEPESTSERFKKSKAA